MFCKKCGKELDEGAAFCSSCGTAVAAEYGAESRTEGDANTKRSTVDSTKIDMFFATNAKKFKPVHVAALRKKMQNIDDEKFVTLQCADLKDPVLMLIISVLVGEFGVDRFIMGDIGIGVLKLLTVGCCGVLWLVDVILFAIGDKVRDKNYANLMALL